MKRIFYILASAFVVASVVLAFTGATVSAPSKLQKSDDTLFETAVEMIKRYETLHQPRHWPLVGYGHMVLPGEKFSRTRAMDEKAAEVLLRKDLLKNCAVFRDWGADSLLLGVLAYNIGSGNVMRSSVSRMLKAGNRDIEEIYVRHCRYRGKPHAGIRRRRVEELEKLFIKDTVIVSEPSIPTTQEK